MDNLNSENNLGDDKNRDDRALVEQAKAGNLNAYEELVRAYESRIHSLIYNMTSNKEDTEDLVQDVFVKAYKSLGRFQGKSSFYTWIYRIAVNSTINFIKRRAKKSALSLDNIDLNIERDPAYVELSAKGSPLKDMSIKELQEKLNKALLTLSEKHRAVVVLHDIQGVPHNEIAKMLGCSSGTIRSRLYYARQRLQIELSEFIV